MVSVGFGGLGLFERRRNQAAFVGAIDAIPSIAAAYSSRRLRSAYTGSLLRIRRSSDNTESDFGYTADGHLDTAAVASFIGGGSGYIVTWYDQSGNGYDATQTTAASQPLYVSSGQNGRPVLRFDGTDDYLVTSSVPADGWSISVCFSEAAANKTILGAYKFSGGIEYRFYIKPRRPENKRQYAAGSTGSSLLAGASVASGVQGMAGKNAYINGASDGTIPAGSLADCNAIWIGATDFVSGGGSFEYFNGLITEIIISTVTYSALQMADLSAAANAYWAVHA